MIETITQEATVTTPRIVLDASAGIIEMRGSLVPENSQAAFAPILTWLEAYAQHPANSTCVNLYFEYFNTSSSKYLLDFFKILENIHFNGYEVSINWMCERNDEDMIEAGEDYQAIVNIPIRISTI